MKVQGSFNKISDTLKALIPPLKEGEVITYQLLTGVPNPDTDENEKKKNPVLYGKIQIPTNDRIYDKWQKDNEGKESPGYVDIGAVAFFEKDTPHFIFLFPGMGHSIFSGKFSLMMGKIEDDELYEFLSLSNRNESNPNRDKSITPLFKQVNALADSKAASGKIGILKRAINAASDIDEADARKLAASLNWNDFSDFQILKAEIETYASRNPDKFLAAYDDPKKDIKADLKFALDAKIIDFDMSTLSVKMGESILTRLTDSSNILGGIFSWQQSAKNGDQVLEGIRKQLTKNKIEVVA